MPESEDNLLDYNKEKILANLLAIEEHMREEGLNQIECDTWCAKKHYLLAKDHHLDEAISHADDDERGRFKEFRENLKGWHKDGKDIEGLRKLRNRFREIAGDETIHVKCQDGVCHYDTEGMKENEEDEDKEEKELNSALDSIVETVEKQVV